MVEIDGSHLSGSGSIVRQATSLAAVTGVPVHVFNARANRSKPGLRRQHMTAVRAVRDLVGGTLEGVEVGSREFRFTPGSTRPSGRFAWDIGSAGSTTALALALLPVLVCLGDSVEVELHGGLFQDHAPSPFHLQHVVARLIGQMGRPVTVTVVRPGYVPSGEGILRVEVKAPATALKPVNLLERGDRGQVCGIALASHLDERRVAERIADAARDDVRRAGIDAEIEERRDITAAQPGASFALFADFENGCRLGADCAGAPHRRAERIGHSVAHQLLDDVACGATVDRYAADQLIPLAALAPGASLVRAPSVTEHMQTAAWLAEAFLDRSVRFDGVVSVAGRIRG